MIDNTLDIIQWLAKLNSHMNSVALTPINTEPLKDAIYSFAMFGMTQQTMVDMKAIGTMVIVSALSAFGGSFMTARDNALELKQYARAQEEFRIEMRAYMRDATVEIRSLSDRMTRQEITSSAYHAGQNGMPGMNGMNGGVRNGK